MAGHATHLIARVAALNPSHLRGLIQVAGEAELVSFPYGEVQRIADVLLIRRPGMYAAGTVTGFASLPLPAPLGVLFHSRVRVHLKRFEDIFVTTLASGRAYRGGRSCGHCGGLLGSRQPVSNESGDRDRQPGTSL